MITTTLPPRRRLDQLGDEPQVVRGRVRADHDHRVGVVEVVERDRGGAAADRALQRHAERHQASSSRRLLTLLVP
ncbi:MAG: hypothetical protein U1F09_16340 [Steroidobacteraceae bacterium]